MYDLFAVSNHMGGTMGGHYTAYAQNYFEKKWYNFDDSYFGEVHNLNKIVSSSAYNLFYRRRVVKSEKWRIINQLNYLMTI